MLLLFVGLAAGGCGDVEPEPEDYAQEVAGVTGEFTRASAEAMREMAGIVGSEADADEKSRATAATRSRVAAAAGSAEAALVGLKAPDGLSEVHAALISFFVALEHENEVAARFFASPSETLKTELAVAQERTRSAGVKYERHREVLADSVSTRMPQLGFPVTEPSDRPVAALSYRAFLEELLLAVPEILSPLDRLQTALASLTGRESDDELAGIYRIAAEETAVSRARLAELRETLSRTIAPEEYAAAHGRAEDGLTCLAQSLEEFEGAFKQIGDGESTPDLAAAGGALGCYRREWAELLRQLDLLSQD